MRSYFNYKLDKEVFEVSEDEKKEIEIILSDLKQLLNQYVEDERINLDEEIHPFITNENKRRKLAKINYDIIENLCYDEGFTDIVFFKNGFVEFTKTDKLFHFVSAYNLLDDTFEALRVLKNILKVKLIGWLIENYYNNDNARKIINKIPKNITTSNVNFRKDIFRDPESENLFKYIVDNTYFTLNRKFVNTLFYEFTKYLSCTKYKFAEYWNTLPYKYEVNLYDESKSADIKYYVNDEIKQEIEHLITEFNK